MTEAPRVTVFRKEHFNAAHRLHNPLVGQQRKTKKFLVYVTILTTMDIIMK